MTATVGERATRVTTLELFFDLVFVFTITQLTSVIVDKPTWTGLLEIVLMLGVIFWMYGGYAWLTNEIALDRTTRRLTLLGGMGGLFVVALAVPTAFDGSGLTFGLAYLAVVLIHMGMFARSSHLTVVQAVRGLAPFNLATASLVVIGGAIGGTTQYVLWGMAFLGEWLSPFFFSSEGFVIEPRHFVERHGLVIIIAIGESVIAVGAGAAGLPVDAELVIAALLGLALSATLWWSYFGEDEDAPERAMRAAPPNRRPKLAVRAFGYWHMLMLLGIVLMAAALKEGMHHPFDPLAGRWALALAGGAFVFLLGEALFRATLNLGGDNVRAVAALIAMVTVPLGSEGAVTAQTAALVALIVAVILLDRSLAPGVGSHQTYHPSEGRRPMYARVSTWEGAEADAMRQTAEQIKSADGPPPGVESVGITMLYDPQTKRSMAIALFETEDDYRQGDEALNAMDPPTGDAAGRRTGVEKWEVAVERRLSGASA